MAEATRKDIEQIFGRENVSRWADLDNDKDQDKIQERIENSLADSLDYIYGRIKGRYGDAIPFTNTPRIIKYMNALYAGMMLYDSRLIVSENQARDQVSRHRKDFRRLIREILSGQLRLIDGLSGEVVDYAGESIPFAGTVSSVSCCCPQCRYDPCRCQRSAYFPCT